MVESEDPRLDALAQSVARLDERVRRLEQLLPPALAADEPETELEAEPTVRERWFDLALIGRSVIVLGLGYLLRAGTDLQVVPDAVGAGAGLALALGLVALGDRAGARGRRVSAVLHGTTALAIALPLIGELVVRFGLVGPAVAAVLMLGFARPRARGRGPALAGAAGVGHDRGDPGSGAGPGRGQRHRPAVRGPARGPRRRHRLGRPRPRAALPGLAGRPGRRRR